MKNPLNLTQIKRPRTIDYERKKEINYQKKKERKKEKKKIVMHRLTSYINLKRKKRKRLKRPTVFFFFFPKLTRFVLK
jgi:hypothetical protein